jgi:hypothetical protein
MRFLANLEVLTGDVEHRLVRSILSVAGTATKVGNIDMEQP